jgi:hypothetical protein
MIPVRSVASIVRPGGAAMVGRDTSPALARTGDQARLQMLWAVYYSAYDEHPACYCHFAAGGPAGS